ncbi:MAG: hypothetical protein ABIV50_09515 [Opitutus sp.]
MRSYARERTPADYDFGYASRITPAMAGGDESQLPREMMAGYASLLRHAQSPVETIDVPNEGPFSVLAEVGDPARAVHQAVLSRL